MSFKEGMSLRVRSNRDSGTNKRGEAGFSLVELMIVCVILVIISGIAIPNIVRINRSYKLNAAGHAVASLVQTGRMQAVKLNQPQYAQYDAAFSTAFVNDGSTTTYSTGNPDVGMAAGMSFSESSLPVHTQLDTYVGGTLQVGGKIGFNARGLPCVASGSVCPSATGQSFEWFIKDNFGGWEAVTVTPAGRIKSWRLTSTSGVWQ
jgi:prepilin-type N-terminal cleavage/methylation domain-containing protein